MQIVVRCITSNSKMLTTLAVSNYRSILNLVVPLGPLNLITGPNGSGKSNLYRSLRLLAECADGGVVNALAREGGLSSTFWAGPESLSKDMKAGKVSVQGGPRKGPVRMRLGFSDEEFGYSISLGLPPPPDAANPEPTKFSLDPEIKQECIWAGGFYRTASSLVDRQNNIVKVRNGRSWEVISKHLNNFESLFTQVSDASKAPEIISIREQIKGWRFYDHFRTDQSASSRIPQLGTRTPVLDNEGHDLAAAIQTIREIGDHEALNEAISDAFPGTELSIEVQEDNRFSIKLNQDGLLRPLTGTEFSDGTLRYLLLVAALLTPRPPQLMVLNEPETSLHPDLLPALARLIIKASENTQVWVVSHASRLISALSEHPECNFIELEKQLGETTLINQGMIDEPAWYWPSKS